MWNLFLLEESVRALEALRSSFVGVGLDNATA